MARDTVIPLVHTKLFIPQVRQERVRRDRLTEELNRGLQCPLILLSSLPGSGKTTALADWVACLTIPAAWIALDESDNDLSRFLRYFVSALQSIFPAAGKSLQPGLDATDATSNDAIMASLIADLTSQANEFVLVLDDFHVIHSGMVQSFLAHFLERQPRQMHLVIATRTDPQFPLSRLRSRNKILELRIDDLRFTSAETDEYINRVMGLNLSKDDLFALETRTEGWIASLQMAAISMKQRADPRAFIQSFSGSNRFIMDYLVEEVLTQQSEQVQNFLLRTSILDRLNGALCDAVCQDNRSGFDFNPAKEAEIANGQAMLEWLERSNLFITPLDDERIWYRYHHLIATLLRAKLSRSKTIPVSTLHLLAADWFEKNDHLEEAIDHALSAQDFQRAADLIERIAETVWLNGQYTRLSRWIRTLPEQMVDSRPWLCVWNAWSCSQTGVLEEANAWIERAEKSAQTPNPDSFADQPLRYHLSGLKVLSACLAQDFERAVHLAAWVLDNPPPAGLRSGRMAQCHILHGLSYKYFIDGDLAKAEQANLETIRLSNEIGFTLRQLHGSNKLAYVYLASGQFKRCYRFLQDALADLAERGLGDYFAAVALRFRLVDLLYAWDQLEALRQLSEEHLAPTKIADVPYLRVDAYNIQARYLLQSGDIALAENALKKASALIQNSYIWPGLAWQTESLQVQLWLQSGNRSAAEAWAAGLPEDQAEPLPFASESREISRARILIAGAAAEVPHLLLKRLEISAIAGRRNGSLIEIYLLQATAFQREERLEPAASALEKAMALAEPEGYCRIFVDMGQPIADVLKYMLQKKRSPHRQFERFLLAKFENNQSMRRPPYPAVDLPSAPPRTPLIEPLSKRELEVIRCIAAGLSNAETAAKLVIEKATVKRHINSIFAKLGVTNRVQAVNSAKENELL